MSQDVNLRIGHVNGDHLWYGAGNGYDAAFADTENIEDEDNYAVAVVLKSIHDRIVAELKAGTANALKRVFNRQIGYMVSANAFRVLCEEIEKYDPFFKMPNSSERKRFVADRNAEMQKLKETIARQARVIEKLRISMATALELESCGETSCPIPMRAMCSTPSHKELRKTLLEITAIEQGEGA